MALRIFYLDDEKDLLEMFCDIFSSPDFEITTFCDPKSFLEAIKLQVPDLVILDYRLPGCNGDEIAQQLDVNLPKLLITGDIEVKTKSRFVSTVGKPFKIEDVKAILNSQLSIKNGTNTF